MNATETGNGAAATAGERYARFARRRMERYPFIRERFDDLKRFRARHGRLPCNCESEDVTDLFVHGRFSDYYRSAVYASAHLRGGSGMGYAVIAVSDGDLRFATYDGPWWPPSETNMRRLYSTLCIERAQDGSGRDPLLSSVGEAALNPDEALEAFEKLFGRVCNNLLAATACCIF